MSQDHISLLKRRVKQRSEPCVATLQGDFGHCQGRSSQALTTHDEQSQNEQCASKYQLKREGRGHPVSPRLVPRLVGLSVQVHLMVARVSEWVGGMVGSGPACCGRRGPAGAALPRGAAWRYCQRQRTRCHTYGHPTLTAA